MPKPSQPPYRPSTASRQSAPQPELVDPAFLLKGLGVAFGTALILAYITLCVVYARSQWQLVLHPSRTLAASPASFGLNATEVHFGIDSSGEPQLDGWWIAADSPAQPTALLLHDGSGSMGDALPAATVLHNASLNVLLFDYRGFGRSGGGHPTQAKMQEDAESALSYLSTTSRAYPGGLAAYGIGLGGSVAVDLAEAHPQIAAVILQDPDGDMRSRAVGDIRSHFVPASLLFREEFPLTAPLGKLETPKLLIAHTGGNTPTLFRQAASPKMTVELSNSDASGLAQAIARFRDSYLH